MDLSLKIMLAAGVFLGGFLWAYLFLRQVFYNFLIAYPMIRRMNALQPDLIAVGAKRYTNVSVIVSLLFALLVLGLILHFCPLYIIISFAVGGLLSVVLFLPKMKLNDKGMFELFCNAYYHFVPDDALRTALYNRDAKAVKARLREMEIKGTFLPDFKKK